MHSKAHQRQSGFTLVELMIVVVIIAILAAVAIPNYQKSVVRGKRAAAQAQMLTIASLEQQHFLANREYADKATLGYSLPADVAAGYDYDIFQDPSCAAPCYEIRFTAKGAQLSDGNLTLDNYGTKTPPEKWK